MKSTKKNTVTINLNELDYTELKELREIVARHMRIEQITAVQKEMAKREK